jgi:hypothetical protein
MTSNVIEAAVMFVVLALIVCSVEIGLFDPLFR